eukprot:GFUD01013752.1.p1 GENE.GFUD01013752.1~~GFUD01013752.1.p1  ORF type:complete len:614 (-),score=212.76 GFUD01013752.1:76-1917(-)
MLQTYGLTLEIVTGAPSLSPDFAFSSSSSNTRMASASPDPEKEPQNDSESVAQQQKERGQRKPSDIIVETFVRPGDESWAERAAAALSRKSSSKSLASKESSPEGAASIEAVSSYHSKETSPAGASWCSKESTPSESSRRSFKDTSPLSFDDKINFISGNPFVEVTKGIFHLFKQNVTAQERTEMMCMLGVPAKHKTPDLLQLTAPCHQDLEYMRIVHDSSPNQYMVLLKFRCQEAAKEFHSAYNGLPYNNLEPEVCSVLPVSWVEHSKESEYYPGTGTELPYCTICLERMDESVSTVLTILCNHKFHSSCLAQWEDPTCPVCRYVQTPEVSHDHMCLDCQSTADLWICLVCGYVGCGRYAGGHAHKHFLDTQHCYSMELGHDRVWDYVGDNFVHRLVQNNEDGKLVEQEAQNEGGKHGRVSGVMMNKDEKMDSLQLEYTYLLTSQLEDQRRYFETKLGRVEEAAGKELLEVTNRAKQSQEEKDALKEELESVKREKSKVDVKLSQMSIKFGKLSTELEEEKQLNKSLRQNQEEWQTRLKRAEIEINVIKEVKDKEIGELKEQVRDLMFYLEAQAKVKESPMKSEIEGGSIVMGEAADETPKKPSKGGRKRKN